MVCLNNSFEKYFAVARNIKIGFASVNSLCENPRVRLSTDYENLIDSNSDSIFLITVAGKSNSDRSLKGNIGKNTNNNL